MIHDSLIFTSELPRQKGRKEPFILMLRLGENLFDGILRCANEMKIESASLVGLGALKDVTVAYYELETKQYQTKLFEEDFELINLSGNISTFEGKPFVHIHAALGRADYSVIGGHLMDATVSICVEVTITPLQGGIDRKYDAQTGLKLMCHL